MWLSEAGFGGGELGDSSQKVQTSGYQVNLSWGCDGQHGDNSQHCCMGELRGAKRVNPRSAYQKEKKNFPLETIRVMDVNQTYCGNHFTIYLSQIILMYTLNLYSVVCQLYLNKTRKKY